MDLSKSYDWLQPEKIKGKIHIIGCGAVGSWVAVWLARSGFKNLVLYDMDVVEPHNVCNQAFNGKHIGMAKVEALKDIICDINPELEDTVKLEPEGWQGKTLSGYIFLCVDNIDIRRKFVEQHIRSDFVKAVIDCRNELTGAQIYAADWADEKMKQDLLNTMQFTHEEAVAAAPVSACGVTLGVCMTTSIVTSLAVYNFTRFVKGDKLKKFAIFDGYNFMLDAFE